MKYHHREYQEYFDQMGKVQMEIELKVIREEMKPFKAQVNPR